MQKRAIVIQSIKIKEERLLLRKLKTIICYLFDKNQNHNGSKQIPLQYETVNPNPKLKTHKQSTHITLVYIYIHTWPHTHKNSNTQTHSQTTINTHTQHNRGRSQEEKSGREKLGGTDYSVLQFENLKKKNCNDLFEREKLGEGKH